MTSALDRRQTSDKSGAHILKKTVDATVKATVAALGVEDVAAEANLVPVCSSTALGRNRRKNRETVAASIEEGISSAPGPFLVHWDGKLLADGEGKLIFIYPRAFLHC